REAERAGLGGKSGAGRRGGATTPRPGAGWSVARADEFSVSSGEMTFRNGGHELELRWELGSRPDGKLADRAAPSDLASTATVAGVQAHVYRYAGTNDFTAVWLRGHYTLEARGIAADLRAFTTLIGRLSAVGVDAWLSAMPENVVKPASRPDPVREMLEGTPVLPGFDTAPLRAGDAVGDRYQLGAEVAGAVACEWIRRWIVARSTGDEATVREAVSAMASSHDWKILREMTSDGGYP